MNLRALTPRRLAGLFAASNIAFLAVDVALAHTANAFAHPMEWAPVAFSIVATLLLLPGALGSNRPWVVLADRLVGGGSIAVGVAGMIFHLQSAFFTGQTLHNLVYSAPFIAPLSYTGIGLLILLLRSTEPELAGDGRSLGPWIVVLALGGHLGNFALSVLDHAQNGFFHGEEWVPVGSAALAVAALLVTLARPTLANIRMCHAVMALQVAIGILGFVLHNVATYRASATSLTERFVYGAPAFAPLLFADLAVLAAIGLWAMARTTPLAHSSRGAPTRAAPPTSSPEHATAAQVECSSIAVRSADTLAVRT